MSVVAPQPTASAVLSAKQVAAFCQSVGRPGPSASAVVARGKQLQCHATAIEASYQAIDPKMRTFVDLYYQKRPYPVFCRQFQTAWSKSHPGQDGRMALWQAHIQEFLHVTMTWPDDRPDCHVSDLPTEDKEVLIDYLGYEIGLHRGQGNTSLIDVYQALDKSQQ
jgi:hypothetical protein